MKNVLTAFVVLFIFASVPVHAFDGPERLEYEISWLGIVGGYSSLEVTQDEDGRILIVSEAHSVDWLSGVFLVDDLVESISIRNSPDWFPVSYRLDQTEGDRRHDWLVEFDRETDTATFTDIIEKRTSVHELPEVVFDPLTVLYEIRTRKLEPGTSEYIPLFDSEMFYQLEVKVIERESVKVPAGKFDTIHISPLLQSEGIFSREGPIDTWLTDDERKIPVLIKTKVKIGSIKAKLIKIE